MAFSSACFLFVVSAVLLLDSLSAVSKGSPSRDKDDKKWKVKTITRQVGTSHVKFKCRYGNTSWRKDGDLINPKKIKIVTRIAPDHSILIFRKNIEPKDAGSYTCSSNGSVVVEWKLSVSDRAPRNTQECAQLPGDSHCKLDVCKKSEKSSYPGKPLNVTTEMRRRGSGLVMLVKWKNPSLGYKSLCAYQIHIVGLTGHAGHSKCRQINKTLVVKEGCQAFPVLFGAQYRVIVQSLPVLQIDQNAVSRRVTVKDKCDFLEAEMPLITCCAPGQLEGKAQANVSSTGYINMSWVFDCNSSSIEKFEIRWTNLQNPESCYGSDEVEHKNGSVFRYVIALSEACFQRINPCNYTVRVNGVNREGDKSKTSGIVVSIPLPTHAPAVTASRGDDLKITVAVVGAVLGTLICLLFFIYRHFFQKVTITLPVPRTASTPDDGPEDDLVPPTTGEKSRVFIMHTKCCEKCSWVTHCLGSLLNSTGLIEVTLDMWNTLAIVPNVARWYEDQIKSNEYVVVLVSHKMFLRSRKEPQNEDPLSIGYQLNLVRGEISSKPEIPKYVPVYFTYNSDKQDIPACMSPRWAHSLMRDIDRLVFHLTRVEEVRPYRTQPVVLIAADGHPYGERKRELERAVRVAAEHHQPQQNNSEV